MANTKIKKTFVDEKYVVYELLNTSKNPIFEFTFFRELTRLTYRFHCLMEDFKGDAGTIEYIQAGIEEMTKDFREKKHNPTILESKITAS